MNDVYKKYNLVVFGFSFIALLTVGTYVYRVDPYWLFSRNPVWRDAWDGHNRVLDIKMRFAKSLEVVFRQPGSVIIGSSRVYRGMATDGLYGGDVYNLGIASLRIREAYAYLRHVLRWTPVENVVFGLDYFMFDHSRGEEEGFDPTLADFRYLFKAVPSSLLTFMSVGDTKLALEGEHRGDGYWTYSGYKYTNRRTAEEVTRVLNSFYNERTRITSQEYGYLKAIIALAKENGVDLTFFISPLNKRMITRMKAQGDYSNFTQWKMKVKSIIGGNDILVYDFSESNPYYFDNTENGSTEFWIDTSHYSPLIGGWILREIGFQG